MKSLFIKIFTSFWIAMIAIVGISALLSIDFERQRHREKVHAKIEKQFFSYVRNARRLLINSETEVLKQWVFKLEAEQEVKFFIINNVKRDILQRPLPQRVTHLYTQYKQRHENSKSGLRPHPSLFVHPIFLPDNQHYLIIAHIPPNHKNLITRFTQPKLILRLLLAFVISGLVCFLLARSLTKPLKKLRSAAQQIAKGELNTNVSEEIGFRKDEFGSLAKDVDNMSSQLQKLLTSHQQLLRDMSHELRSPLARLQVALDLARQSDTSHINTKELNRIELEANRLNDLIGYIITIAKLNNQPITNIETIHLNQLIEQLVDNANYEYQRQDKSIKLTSTSIININANKELIYSSIDNVLRNAMRFTPEKTTVMVNLDQENEWTIIKIIDHGPGVPENQLNDLFDPFVRLSNARERQSGNEGYGLGLAIAKQAIEHHGGVILANNHAPTGLIVTIKLPLTK